MASDRSLSLLGKKLRCVRWIDDGPAERDETWLAEWAAQRSIYHDRRAETARRLAGHAGMVVATDGPGDVDAQPRAGAALHAAGVRDGLHVPGLDPRKLGAGTATKLGSA